MSDDLLDVTSGIYTAIMYIPRIAMVCILAIITLYWDYTLLCAYLKLFGWI